MRTYHLQNTDLDVSCLAYGCMKMGGEWARTPLTALLQTDFQRRIRDARQSLDDRVLNWKSPDAAGFGASGVLIATRGWF